ncbi:MAG: hypothetical protein QG629_607 [Patescibacteria group bacterium]|nr:hypothetical protein [Candidatus Saccharibacteria bacterium]MDQ5963525.1 hypothetical protein [Patescibacteria group bacterium]
MSVFDDAKQKAEEVANRGKDWVDQQGGLEGAKDKATDVLNQAKEKAKDVDLPGEWDNKLKDKIGL